MSLSSNLGFKTDSSVSDSPAPSGHFPPLDGLRGIAILLVVFHHAVSVPLGRAYPFEWLLMLNRSGWVGVNLFFVLSGFLIGGILIESRGQPNYYQNFYARRSLRIFPLYYLFLFAFFYVMPRLGLDLEGTALNYAYKGIYFGYVANLSELFGITAKPAALDSLWSLSVEEQVYLIWPALIALCPKRWLVRAMLGIVAVSLGWRVAVLLTHRSILFAFAWPPACLDAFAIGTLAAVAVRVPDRARVALLTGRLLWASGLIVAAIYFWQGNFSFWIFPRNILSIGLTALATFFGAFIVWLVCDRPESLANRALSVSWLRSIGKYSYAIYLVHMLVEEWMMAIGNRYVGVDAYRTVPWQLLNGLSTFVISYILAFMSWHLIEKHFLKLKRAFPSKGAGVPVRTN